MPTNKSYETAEEAVGYYIEKHWPNYLSRWPYITPQSMGLNADDWTLDLSKKMLDRYKDKSGATGTIGAPERRSFHPKILAEYVVRLSKV